MTGILIRWEDTQKTMQRQDEVKTERMPCDDGGRDWTYHAIAKECQRLVASNTRS